MDEERQQIMEMLAAGTITADEADQLLEAITAERPASTGPTQRIDSQQPDTPAGTATNVFANLSLDQIIQLRTYGVTPDYIRQFSEAGLTDLSFDQLLQLGIHNVDPDFVREMRAAGFDDLSVDKLVELSIHNVDPDFIRQIREVGR